MKDFLVDQVGSMRERGGEMKKINCPSVLMVIYFCH